VINKQTTPRPRRLECTRTLSNHQKTWFAEVQERVAAGEPLAVVGVDTPHEILAAMGIPYVVAPWWSSVCAARDTDRKLLGALTLRGYPDSQTQYVAMGLASAFLPEEGPWGGLPTPTFFVSHGATGPEHKIMQLWAREAGAPLFAFERTIMARPVQRWWEQIDTGWEEVLHKPALDLMEAEIREFVSFISSLTGRTLDAGRLEQALELSNQQALAMREARDLIAEARLVPADIAETMPATTLIQWHSGTQWGVDAARAFRDELTAKSAARVDGDGTGPEKRLIWMGNPPWFDLRLFDRLKHETGAVFVWSMYLGIAADGYYRAANGNPLRALAARHGPHRDLLSAPPWNAEWIAKEALAHRVQGAVHFITDVDRGSPFIRRELEAAGIPVLEVHGDAVDRTASGDGSLDDQIGQFVNKLYAHKG
jgi:hypothetical protein